jgi:hypothetical protein
MSFWRFDKTTADVFPDSLPWLFVRGSADIAMGGKASRLGTLALELQRTCRASLDTSEFGPNSDIEPDRVCGRM